MKNKKIFDLLITFLIVITLNFFIPRLMPGDPFMYLEAEDGEMLSNYSEQDIQRYKAFYNLDKPIGEQYILYLKNLLKFDLGFSIYYKHEVSYLIKSRFKWTLPVVLLSIAISSVIGTIIGSISAWKHNSIFDKLTYFFMVFVNEIPSFLIGILFLFILAAKYKFFPLSGGFSMYKDFTTKQEQLFDIIHHAMLPALTLATSSIGGYYLYARNSMLTILSKDYIKTARAKGLRKNIIIFRHMLRNAINPIITRVFLSLGSVVGGAILVENIFAYPGIGLLMQSSIKTRDYPLLQGVFLVTSFTVLIASVLADLINRKLDPRHKNE